MNNIESRSYKINDEITINKELSGIIRYIGQLETDRKENNKEEWIGIELYEPKGKHNGTLNGKKYFECEEKHGLFVKLEKLKNNINNEKQLNNSAFLESTIYSLLENDDLSKSKEKRYKKKFEQEVLQKEAQKGFYLKMIKDLKSKVNELEFKCQFFSKNNKKDILKTIDILLEQLNQINSNIDVIFSNQKCLVWDFDTLRVRELLKILINKIINGENYERELKEYKVLLAKEGIFLN